MTAKKIKTASRIESFNFPPGRKVGKRYVIESCLGRGTEGEVYQLHEIETRIKRAGKFYYPHRDPKQKISTRHARKLNTLRYCPIVLQYHHSEIITVRRQKVVAMISELCEGEPLEHWIGRYPGGRLPFYTALHVLYNLMRGLEAIHMMGEYHADVHSQNILIQPCGVRFNLKLVDFYDWGRPALYKQRQDLCDAVAVFYECLGGRACYAKLPIPIKHICAGMRRDLIIKRFGNVTGLRRYLETFDWAGML